MRPPLRPDAIDRPARSRLGVDDPHAAEILARHRDAVAAGRDTYTDPRTGLSVMTAAALVERGWCCEAGCRHCPYTATTDKAAWRTWARATLAGVDLVAASATIVALLARALPAVPGRILVYRALPTEIDLWPLVEALGPGRFALTRTPERGPLTVHGAEGPLERHRLGFEQPIETASRLGMDAVGAVLVPGLAFDRRGVRLGRGAGHYDRLLSGAGPATLLIGVAAEALVVPELPVEPHDVSMTRLVTERGLTALGEPGSR